MSELLLGPREWLAQTGEIVRFAWRVIGDVVLLTGRTIASAVRPPYPYGGELVSQFLFALRLVWFPLLITTVAISYGAPGLQAANFLTLFGTLDRLGGFFVLASIREFAPFVTAIVPVLAAPTPFDTHEPKPGFGAPSGSTIENVYGGVVQP